MNRYMWIVALCVGIVFLNSGCATTKKAAPYEFKTYRLEPELYSNPPRSVAILPFSSSLSESKLMVENWKKMIEDKRFDIDEEQRKTEEYLKRVFVRRAFYKHFSVKPYRDRELIAVDQLLKSKSIEWAEDLQQMSPQELAALLNVDALIYGEITHLNRVYLGLYSEVTVGAIITMLDARTGEIIWQSREVEKNRAGGASLSLTGLATSILSASMNMRKIWVFRVADELFRRVADQLPDLDVAVEPILIVSADKTPLLKEPGIFGTSMGVKKVATLNAGTTLTLIEEADEWYHVSTADGTEGWIDSKGTTMVENEIGRPFDVESGPEDMEKPTNEEMAGLYDLQGMELFKEGDFHKAHEALAKAVRYDPKNASIHFHLAWATRMDPLIPEDERLRLSIRHLREAVNNSPDNVHYRYNLGLAYNEADRPAKALAEWKQCLELDPSLESVKTLISITEEMMADHDQPLLQREDAQEENLDSPHSGTASMSSDTTKEE